jgi:hypothetical protein
LRTLLDALPAELVAIQVGLFLDGGRNAINTGDTLAVDGLLGE